MPLIPGLESIIKQEETAFTQQSHSEIPEGKIAISDRGIGKSQSGWLFCYSDLQVEPQLLSLGFY